ncbi:DUF3817 domain-containing protein [Glycomyces xiaoerkulensis]|uniref:DUF3817 domain-containing protein n=1 Tax=Glycomyces xiaoerkulensis TaxID=2038139 RepID=UPI0018E42D76|nr:DUF3817 domain-containing protein [Glycomyces xiaoerkulensis]
MYRPVSRMGRLFAAVAFIEAATWAGLLAGMYFKYIPETTELGVQIFGRLHGGAFIAYVAVTLVAAVRLRWRWWVAGVALAASIPPLATAPVEVWLRRTGRLAPRAPAKNAETEMAPVG